MKYETYLIRIPAALSQRGSPKEIKNLLTEALLHFFLPWADRTLCHDIKVSKARSGNYTPPPCVISGCDLPITANGMCGRHNTVLNKERQAKKKGSSPDAS